jgi:type I restriction enzyme S subunit
MWRIKSRAILGQEHIQKDGKISLNASKFTTKTKSNIKKFYVKQNDFFVSRGNTVELVALASVVTDEVEENILYPDLYIRVDFDKKFVNKQYMAFLFNSFIGRIYFGHVAKGKNQTMVKVSSKELYDFHLPIPAIDVQEEILKEVQVKIELQKKIDRECC